MEIVRTFFQNKIFQSSTSRSERVNNVSLTYRAHACEIIVGLSYIYKRHLLNANF